MEWLLTLSSVQLICSVVSESLRPHELHLTRLPCPSPPARSSSNSCASNRWCHPTISSSVIPFSFCLQSFTASGSFLMSQFFASGVQSIGASASVHPMNIQDWFPVGTTLSASDIIPLLSTGWSSNSAYGLPWWRRWSRICLQWRRSWFSPWVGRVLWRREWLPTVVFLPEEFHGQRSLVGYSPWEDWTWLHK